MYAQQKIKFKKNKIHTSGKNKKKKNVKKNHNKIWKSVYVLQNRHRLIEQQNRK